MLVHFRHGVTQSVSACWFGADRSANTRAIGEIRPLPAQRGCVVVAAIRLHTLAAVVDYLGASGQSAIIDATEIRVRRPVHGTDGRDRWLHLRPGQAERGESPGRHRYPWAAAVRRRTQAWQLPRHHPSPRVELLGRHRGLRILADAGYQGLGAQTVGQVITPPHRRIKKNAPTWWEERVHPATKGPLIATVRVEHGIAHLNNWRAPARHHGRRELFDELVPAVAGLASIRRPSPHPASAGCATPRMPRRHAPREPCTSSLGLSFSRVLTALGMADPESAHEAALERANDRANAQGAET
ncbi:transposase family protein [Streptomyces sp. AC558_RSS880]|uniref:transposase family protein n=1 Tax=Streptomyces sp. AC558_RSS880 TaxID=2823687 RepID=UPI0020B76E9D|nr:transposase family protein [Streptomyces sp. AC558_RSS880]